jgi:transposase-like protein
MPKPISSDLPDSKVSPDPKLEKRSCRIFPPEYKLKIIALADACAHGELGPLLRQEGLYSGQLKQWREEFANHGVEGLAKSQPGPKSALTPDQKELEKLRRQCARLERELDIANGCLDLQKKALAMLDLTNNGKEQ